MKIHDFCNMKVFVTAATSPEMSAIKDHFDSQAVNSPSISTCYKTTGIGMMATCFNLTRLIFDESPDLVIQVGIAGAFDPDTPVGTVVAVDLEYVGDLGVYENGRFNNTFQMGLEAKDSFPFIDGGLLNPWMKRFHLPGLPVVHGVTINEISTQPERIHHLSTMYGAFVESMEGAALHYTCLQTKTPFLQFRSVSNLVGQRDKQHWNIPVALRNLTSQVVGFLDRLDLTDLKKQDETYTGI